VGDFGFILGLLLVFTTFESLDYATVFGNVGREAAKVINILEPLGGTLEVSTLTVICLLLFMGAVGKSAQFPLHVWLPDAMEGPTPISALIHAATMVTAGVFMVARLAPLYDASPFAMDVVAVVGATTMVLGATIALTQTDIKRVVAYSTMSQLGYMIMACGLGAYAAGMYHLLTHGAFKALLFLGCGSVIIALHHEQDMRRMGGLKNRLPVTYWTFVVGSLALAGFPLTAGFFSKDDILASAWAAGPLGQVLSILGLLTALLTAFYSFRLVFVTFWGPSRVDPHHAGHVHEPPQTMTVPLLILAVLSIVTGYLGIPEFLSPMFNERAGGSHASGVIMPIATLIGLLGIAGAYYAYVVHPSLPDRWAERWRTAYDWSFHKWYVDEAYDRSIVRPTFAAAGDLWKRVDVAIIDGAVNGVARAIGWGAWFLRLLQSGQAQHYALGMALGAVVILTMFLMM
jgi:NADH-quinone oxidoreductase subunit L